MQFGLFTSRIIPGQGWRYAGELLPGVRVPRDTWAGKGASPSLSPPASGQRREQSCLHTNNPPAAVLNPAELSLLSLCFWVVFKSMGRVKMPDVAWKAARNELHY